MIPLIVTGVIATVFLWTYSNNKRNQFWRRIPGPKGWPIVGNMPQIDCTQPHVQFAEWVKKYGELFQVNMCGKRILIVNGYKNIYDVLVAKGADFSGRPKSFRIGQMTDDFSNVTFTDRTPKNVKMKKLMMGHIKAYGNGMKIVESIVVEHTSMLIEKLVNSNGCELTINDHIRDCMITMIFLITLGRNPNDEEKEMILGYVSENKDLLTVDPAAELLDVFPPFRFLGPNVWKDIRRNCNLRHSMYTQWSKEVEENRADDGNLIFKMTLGESNQQLYDENNRKQLVWDMFVAGIATTSATLTAYINLLAHRSDVQDKLYEEAISVFGDGEVSWARKQELPYTMANIHELIRYITVTPLALPHVTVCDTKLGGYDIPKGTEVWPNLWQLNHDDAVWGDAMTFRPERYLDSEGQLVRPDHPARKHNLAFGAGHRVCSGETFAITRIFLMTIMLTKRFKILPATTLEEQPTCECTNMKPGLPLGAPSFNVRFEERNKV